MVKTALAPLETTTLATQVQRSLEHAIFTGELKPGERLIEVDLAETLQVSRASLREALRLLENKGLVVTTHRRGAFVIELTDVDVREIYRIRLLAGGARDPLRRRESGARRCLTAGNADRRSPRERVCVATISRSSISISIFIAKSAPPPAIAACSTCGAICRAHPSSAPHQIPALRRQRRDHPRSRSLARRDPRT